MNARQLWESALDRVRARVSAASFTTWFKATEAVELRDDVLVIGVPSSFAREHLRQRFHELAVNAVGDVLGRPLQVAFIVSGRRSGAARPDDTAGSDSGETAPQGSTRDGAPARTSRHERRPALDQRRAMLDAPRAPVMRGGRSDSLARSGRGLGRVPLPRVAQPPLLMARDARGDSAWGDVSAPHARTDDGTDGSLAPPTAVPTHRDTPTAPGDETPRGASGVFAADPGGRHAFATFVVGTANRLAYAAAREVAGTPGQRYNPLFIWGGTGLGKTHLLLAVGHVARSQGLHVCYVPAERFANDIIEAIRHHTTEEFRARYRQVDVLLVDDVQFIAGKESTEEEFFHTFNALHDINRQIVLSSDRTPRAMRQLQDRLRSRFEWGLLADIQPPDEEHRRAILRSKVDAQGLNMPDDVLARVARPECGSVRELEGALNRVLAYSAMLRQPLDVALVDRALAPLRPIGDRQVDGDEVIAAVSAHYGVTPEALRGKARDHGIAWPRQMAMYLLREETRASLGQIGQELGGRDHTTVMHGCDVVSHKLASSDQVRRELEALRSRLRG
jgi:chromosomal replication initiator protein